jgi:hypothetical protein
MWRVFGVCAALLLAGCGSNGTDVARQACTVPGPAVQVGFDPETAPIGQLTEAAAAAAQRAALAQQAANEHARWADLAAAANAVAAFADVLVEARMSEQLISEATTPLMWDQAKFAADAFAAECRMLRD